MLPRPPSQHPCPPASVRGRTKLSRLLIKSDRTLPVLFTRQYTLMGKWSSTSLEKPMTTRPCVCQGPPSSTHSPTVPWRASVRASHWGEHGTTVTLSILDAWNVPTDSLFASVWDTTAASQHWCRPWSMCLYQTAEGHCTSLVCVSPSHGRDTHDTCVQCGQGDLDALPARRGSAYQVLCGLGYVDRPDISWL